MKQTILISEKKSAKMILDFMEIVDRTKPMDLMIMLNDEEFRIAREWLRNHLKTIINK